MAETVPKTVESENSSPDKSSGAIASCWNKFHFSGRVIMCSVLFGFGMILIGSLVFAINMNDDDSTKSENETELLEIPTKAPSNVVGPVVMGIGSFIVIVGIVMCLFETQVCRKKTGDSSPLISEGGKDLESAAGPSTSHAHKHGIRKPGTSPKRSKGKHAKYHLKDRNQQKTPSPRSPPVTIESPRRFLTSSEDSFLTPPNTLSEQRPALVQNNSREAEIQTSSSLMKSFSSSGPSWNQSTEFQTPSTSFRDSSVSLDVSIEIGENRDQRNANTSELRKSNFDAGFLTPVTLEVEKVENIAGQIQNHKKKITNVDADFNDSENGELSEEITSEISTRDDVNAQKASLKLQDKDIEKDNQTRGNTENINALKKQQNQPASIEQINQFIVESKQTAISSELISSDDSVQQAVDVSVGKIINISDDKSAINEIPAVDNIITEDNQRGKTDFREIISKDGLELSGDLNHLSLMKVHLNEDENTPKTESDKTDEQNDLESSVSSDETVVFQDSVLETPSSTDASDKNNSETQKINVTEITNIAESEKFASTMQSGCIDTQKSQNDKPSEAFDCENRDSNLDKNIDKETKDSS